jgi:hypothetical protein
MAEKCLIMYQSMTGNTQQVAFKFKEVFEKHGWNVTTFRVDKNTDPHKLPFTMGEFDFICFGSPIIDSTVAKFMYRTLLDNPDAPMYRGSNSTERLKKIRGKGFGLEGAVASIPGIAFLTYSGAPPEAMPSLRLLEHLMWYMKIDCIGQFGCRGTEPRHASVNWIADHWYTRWYSAKDKTSEFTGRGDIEEAAAIIARYAENPDAPEFTAMTKEQRELLAHSVTDTLPDTHKMTEARPIMPPREKRPGARDLMKAEIFLEEILEERGRSEGPFICVG